MVKPIIKAHFGSILLRKTDAQPYLNVDPTQTQAARVKTYIWLILHLLTVYMVIT